MGSNRSDVNGGYLFGPKTNVGVYLVSSDSFSHNDSEREVKSLSLPQDILFNIAARLNSHKDFIRFGAVCSSWQTVYTDIQHRRAPTVPLLMLATELNHDGQTRSFYSFTDKKVCNSKVLVPHNRYTPGSSKGWLFTVCTQTFGVSILNPFLSFENEIQLPPLTAFGHYGREDFYMGFICKSAWSATPKSPDNVVMAIYNPSQAISFYKHGDNAWTSIGAKYRPFSDVIYYRDQFFAVRKFGGCVFAFDLNHSKPRVTRFAPSPPMSTPPNAEIRRYLVDAFGDLLQVLRIVEFVSMDNENDEDNEEENEDKYNKEENVDEDNEEESVDEDNEEENEDENNKEENEDEDNEEESEDEDNEEEIELAHYFTKGFIVYKWDPVNLMWIRLFHLDGLILFVGSNSSMCVLASKFPECKPNSVYFTDDYYDYFIVDEEREDIVGPHDEGVFSFEDGTIESINPTESKLIYPPPIWIEQPLTSE